MYGMRHRLPDFNFIKRIWKRDNFITIINECFTGIPFKTEKRLLTPLIAYVHNPIVYVDDIIITSNNNKK